MLSRIAESLFWIGRYIERSDGTARILDVHLQLLLEDPWIDEDTACRSLLSVMGSEANDDVALGRDDVIMMPHIGASTEEAEENCAVMAVDQLKDFLENGNIRNSVLPLIGFFVLGLVMLVWMQRAGGKTSRAEDRPQAAVSAS